MTLIIQGVTIAKEKKLKPTKIEKLADYMLATAIGIALAYGLLEYLS